MKIKKPNDIKFTSIKYDGAIVHFKYNKEHYTFENGGTEWTSVIRLSKGRMKHHLEPIKSNYGIIYGLIKYKNNKRTLSNIDKDNFVLLLIKNEILEPTKEQKNKIIQEEISKKKQQIERLKQEIEKLEKK